jgi:hypothetical protein
MWPFGFQFGPYLFTARSLLDVITPDAFWYCLTAVGISTTTPTTRKILLKNE